MSSTEPSEVSSTLSKRGATHGSFRTQSGITQNITEFMRGGRNWDDLPAYAKHAMEMVAVKLGRILTGDWSHTDHWHDIAGYAQLVEKELTK
jgi:hypothetical protein